MKLKTLTLIPIMLAVLYAAPDRFEFDGMRYVGDIEKTFDVGSKGELVMERIRGDVTIEGEARNDVLIVERFKIDAYSETSAQSILSAEKARFQQRGNRIIVSTTDRSRRYSSNFSIKVPLNFNTIVQTSGGDVTISTVAGTQNLNTSGGDVEFTDCQGIMNGRTSGGDIRIRRAEGKLDISTSGGDINLDVFGGDLRANTSGGDIKLNKVKANGQATTSGGDIDINYLWAKTFTARTSGGDIGADKVEGDLNLHTSGGDIILGQIVGNAEVHTSGGFIEARQIDKNLKATTSGGDIKVGLVKGYCYVRTSGGDIEVDRAYDLEAITSGGDITASGIVGYIYARTSGGDIEARKLFRPEVTNNAVDLETSGGDIKAYLPANLNADIDAEITITDRWMADANIRSEFPLARSQDIKGSRIYIYARGKINQGGVIIRLRSVNGDIDIIKTASNSK
ncbi:MAG: DUF4097 family beta strand repeat-containing protein [Candidatus Marinimicrobia bacterium]|nr:DUF4097 domain-containing protein [Candidatus Neomarinimicrobiota bacterium]MDD5062146.1 DUF4097 family beta strand repeat-containing protein [Candidatus Neomarinimicrobiota bacterium]MDD5539934.1 DUF4097 family beta strand repeat-containing protein [Candidatus Neomarinimicrobiota bacterium]